jgi:hypothetical protein
MMAEGLNFYQVPSYSSYLRRGYDILGGLKLDVTTWSRCDISFRTKQNRYIGYSYGLLSPSLTLGNLRPTPVILCSSID